MKKTELDVNQMGDVILKWVMIGIVAFAFALSMTGCNTVRGLGTLMQGVGEDISEAANGIQHQMAETDQ